MRAVERGATRSIDRRSCGGAAPPPAGSDLARLLRQRLRDVDGAVVVEWDLLDEALVEQPLACNLVVEVLELATTYAADQPAQAAHEVGRHDHVEFSFAQRRDDKSVAAHPVGEAVAHQDDLV